MGILPAVAIFNLYSAKLEAIVIALPRYWDSTGAQCKESLPDMVWMHWQSPNLTGKQMMKANIAGWE